MRGRGEQKWGKISYQYAPSSNKNKLSDIRMKKDPLYQEQSVCSSYCSNSCCHVYPHWNFIIKHKSIDIFQIGQSTQF